MAGWLGRLLGLLFCLGVTGCASVAFVGQAATGQAEVMNKARAIDEVLADPATTPETANKLRLAQRLREFAIRELKLPDNASYTRYADLGRPYALWNIVSTPPLSLKPQESCFPIAGCLSYRDYYSEAEAQQYAESRKALGEDVFLYGVPAYSTLGWFSDPLLNTTLRYDKAVLARLIFHELAHQQLYIKDDSGFNEAFATAVELEGYERWLAQEGDAAAREAYPRAEQRRQAFRRLMEQGRALLEAVYASEQADDAKRAAKVEIQAELALGYQALKAEWGGYLGYDAWFQPHPNNAHMASLATYHEKVPAFRALFRQLGGDFSAFYLAVRQLAEKNRAARDEALAALRSAAVIGETQHGATTPSTAAP